MEQQQMMRHMEDQLKRATDQVNALSASLDDLNLRAQKIHSAAKMGQKARDITFGEDIGTQRKRVRTFCQEIAGLPGMADSLDRSASYAPALMNVARSLMSSAINSAQAISNYTDAIRMLHQHITDSDLKIQVWYMVSDLDNINTKIHSIPSTISSKVITKLTTPPADIPPTTPPPKT